MSHKTETIVLGGGCFWCLDAGFRLIEGITEVVSGYAGGTTKNPDYYSVGSGNTGHAEVVKVSYDPSVITSSDILDIFWAIHNPTTLNYQGADHGTQYRSVILYASEDQKKAVEHSLKEAAKLWDDPIVTEVKELDVFYPAEDEHQNYFEKHPEQGYCQVIINPKLAKLRAKFTSRLR